MGLTALPTPKPKGETGADEANRAFINALTAFVGEYNTDIEPINTTNKTNIESINNNKADIETVNNLTNEMATAVTHQQSFILVAGVF